MNTPRCWRGKFVGGLSEQQAREADAQFESTVTRSFTVVLPDRRDFDLCVRYLQRFDTALRGGDALHLAIASNRGAHTFYSPDRKLLRAGKLLGLSVSAGIRAKN